MKKNKFIFSNTYLKLREGKLRKISYLYLYKNNILNKSLRQKNFFFLANKNYWLNKNFSFCLLTGRSRGIVKNFLVSRQTFKEVIKKNTVFGLKKKSW